MTESIVSLAPSTTDILLELGLKEKLIATTSLYDFIENVERLGGWNKGTEFERLNDLDPDLVFTCDKLQRDTRDKLIEQGFNVEHHEPENLEHVYSYISSIGEVTGKKTKARDLVKGIKAELRSIDLQGNKIYCEEWMEPPMVSGNWMPSLIEKCNGRYFIEEGRSCETDLEKLKEFQPDYIFLNVCGAGENIDKSKVLDRDDWKTVKAVSKENVYIIDDSLLNRPSNNLVEGMKRIEKIIEQ